MHVPELSLYGAQHLARLHEQLGGERDLGLQAGVLGPVRCCRQGHVRQQRGRQLHRGRGCRLPALLGPLHQRMQDVVQSVRCKACTVGAPCWQFIAIVKERRCALLKIVHSPLTASGHTSASETSSRTSAAAPWLQRWAAAVASRSNSVASSPAAASKSFSAAIAALTAATAVPSAKSRLPPRQPQSRPPSIR